ncbi:type IV secretory system conjugative DNA transfer family protein [Runella sp. MFBS21]|uniref:type IV secretory system conjugative DNA transfer family protein n=1 Tax=Runella sp. MFBS21 TaxID=3034018 RepID=UPI0023F676EF|nr:type IV secretory system conjugative DNA transfer family protein [Runella sp. MFBS21]MDF7821856.1 type IV secretory system conjugative DNA transfer family protein [Runella sp. MFBS21]
MEATATAKEKEHGKEIYNILLYLLITLLCVQSMYWFTTYFSDVFSQKNGLNTIIFKVGSWMGKNKPIYQSNVLIYIVLVLCVLLAMVSSPKANLKASKTRANMLLFVGVSVLLLTAYLFEKEGRQLTIFTALMTLQSIAVILIIKGGLEFSSMVSVPEIDVFNDENEQFPQNQKLITNPFSVNYKLQYPYNSQWNEGYINVINPQRAVLVLGSQGSGKTFTVLIPALWQSVYKGYSALVYDVKYPDLSLEAFNSFYKALQNNKYTFGKTANNEPIIPKFGVINFDDVTLSIRSNPLDEKYISTIEEANETAKVLMLNLNRTWIKKEGDFFADSAINYLTVTIYYLRLMEKKYADRLKGRPICTLPHCIELIAQNPNEVIGCMVKYDELGAYTAMFQVAMANKAGEQLAGQVASAQNALARLSSPKIYWVMSGNDMDLDINNPQEPKILCLANNPEKINIYSSALSVYTATIMRLIYQFKKKGIKSAFFIDELPSMYLRGLDNFIATVRSYNVATWLGIQDMEQLTKDYGKEQANVIVNTCGTIFSGSVNNQTAETLSKMFGKTNQQKFSTSFQKSDLNVTESKNMEQLIPASKISTLSQGHFVGKVADNFGEEIDLKLFNGYIAVEIEELKKTKKELPRREITEQEVQDNFTQIKEDIKLLIKWELDEDLVD